MIVVTLLATFCGYVGWQEKIVQARRQLRGEGHLMGFQDDDDLPLVRRWLGDHGFKKLFIWDSDAAEFRARVAATFPEAEIETWKLLEGPAPK